jgi:hypothetical protein
MNHLDVSCVLGICRHVLEKVDIRNGAVKLRKKIRHLGVIIVRSLEEHLSHFALELNLSCEVIQLMYKTQCFESFAHLSQWKITSHSFANCVDSDR